MKGLVIAGTNSGCGKTTITIGLMALLQEAGQNIAPFKVGPDFIDPAFHFKVTGTNSYNLDSFLLSNEVINHLYYKHTLNKDIAIVEGVMGLFDGMGEECIGSTAQMSKILSLPVILVVSCKSLYQSVAAIISGYTNFDPDLNIAGVILNNVSGNESYNFLKSYIEINTEIKCLGYLPTDETITLESRHLGLIQPNEIDGFSTKITQLKDILRNTIDLPSLVSIAGNNKFELQSQNIELSWQRDLKGLRIGVAHDNAFQFYYNDNLDLLRNNGAELIFFSPLKDESIPHDINAIYLGGGYPEVFAKELSQNYNMLMSINTAAHSNMPIFAECGGLMYLTEGIIDQQEIFYPMAGIFKCCAKMTSKLQRFGYCNVKYNDSVTSAHEFHNSKLQNIKNAPDFEYQFQIEKPGKNRQWTCGLRYKNVLAGYPHFHFWSEPKFYNQIIDLWMQKTI